WSSDVCSSDLLARVLVRPDRLGPEAGVLVGDLGVLANDLADLLGTIRRGMVERRAGGGGNHIRHQAHPTEGFHRLDELGAELPGNGITALRRDPRGQGVLNRPLTDDLTLLRGK